MPFSQDWSPGLIKFFNGGIISWYRHRLVLTNDARPEADPACPMLGFTDPMAHGSLRLAKNSLRASDSTRSSKGLPLPWVSTKLMEDGEMPASLKDRFRERI